MMKKVLVIGLGYVGLPLAVRAAQAGHYVFGIDMDPNKINILRSGRTYVEDVTDTEIDTMTHSGHLRAYLGWQRREQIPGLVRNFDIAIIAVPTPLKDDQPDLSYVRSATRMVGQVLHPGAAVVLESTTYPGTTEGEMRAILETESELTAGLDFHLGFSPERIDPGNKNHTLRNTPKLVSATTSRGLAVIQDFYDTIVDETVPVSSPRVAELTKLYENIQANVNIALVNEVAELCHDLGIDVWEMLDASMTKGHSMAYWTPGPGVGGHCLPIDPMYLAWLSRTRLDKPFKFAELANEINRRRPVYVVERAADMLTQDGLGLTGTNVLVLGVAYKPNVGDVRESPALDVVHELHRRGAQVTAVDPHVNEQTWSHTPLLPFEDLNSSLDRFPLTIVVTHHDVFDWDKIAIEAPRVLDCRNTLPVGGNIEAL